VRNSKTLKTCFFIFSIDDRLALKKRLGCKPFKWFLDNIYPELSIPEVQFRGSIQQQSGNLCFDTLGKNSSEGVIGLYPCHDGGGNQDWIFTRNGLIKHYDVCLTLLRFRKGSLVVLKSCDERSENQKWIMKSSGMLQHFKMNLCLDSIHTHENGLTVEHCNSASQTQKWHFQSNNHL
jgi:polypeptide N-acetylgalactosaminyltransferase